LGAGLCPIRNAKAPTELTATALMTANEDNPFRFI
jgi:hypothetical protein